MRSISGTKWRRDGEEEDAFLEADLIRNSSTGKEINPMQQLTTSSLDGRRQQKAKQDLEFIEKLVEKRELAALIVLAWQDQMNGTEIQEEFNLTKQQYETEVKWIYRTVRAAFKNEDTNV